MEIRPYSIRWSLMASPNSAEKIWSYYKGRLQTTQQDARKRNEIALIHMNLVREIAHRMEGQCAERYEDLEQIGFVGLTRAIERFNPTKGVAFSSFAVPYIRGEILHFLRDHGSGVKIPRRWREFSASSNLAERAWSLRQGKPPTEQELADEMGCGVVKLRQVREAIANQQAISLDAKPQEIANPETYAEQVEGGNRLEVAWKNLRQSFSELSVKEQDVIGALYFQRESRKAIGAKQHLDASHLRATIHQALSRIAN